MYATDGSGRQIQLICEDTFEEAHVAECCDRATGEECERNSLVPWRSPELPKIEERLPLGEFETRVKSFSLFSGFNVKIGKTYPPLKERACILNRCFCCTSRRCNWKVWVKRGLDGLYGYGRIVLAHNHELSPLSTTQVSPFYFDAEALKLIQEHVVAGTPTCAIHRFLVEHFRVPFDYQTVYNCIRKTFGYTSPWDDASSLTEKLKLLSKSDANFYSDTYLNEQAELTRVFYCPAEGKIELSKFGHLVGIDATYRTNRYRMPLVTFVGEDESGRRLCFCYALTIDETEKSYVWVFERFRDCCCGMEPTVILTDGHKGMRAAIVKTFPRSKHHRCLWHLERNVAQNLSAIIGDHFDAFDKEFTSIAAEGVVSHAMDRMDSLLISNGLETNKYASDLKASMSQWCEAFLPLDFCGRLRTTSTNESHHSLLKRRLNSSKTLCDVFDVTMKLKIKESEVRSRSVTTDFPFLHEQHLSPLCVKLMRKEMKKTYTLHIEDPCDGDSVSVTEGKFIFKASPTSGQCDCNCYCRRGYPCRHVLGVLVKLELTANIRRLCNPFWSVNGQRNASRRTAISAVQDDCTCDRVLSDLTALSRQFSEYSLESGFPSVYMQVQQAFRSALDFLKNSSPSSRRSERTMDVPLVHNPPAPKHTGRSFTRREGARTKRPKCRRKKRKTTNPSHVRLRTETRIEDMNNISTSESMIVSMSDQSVAAGDDESDGDGRSEEEMDDGSQSSEERRPVRVFVAEENGTHITRLECESVTDPDESFDSDDSRYWRHHIVRYREIDAEEADEIQGQTETQTHVDTTVTTRAGRVVQPKTWGEDFELTHRGKR